jgi:lipopolysaccharide biosynthesis glycosyltransferase
LNQLPIKRRGLTEFTFSRFLVPHLCGYQGLGLFLDADMLVQGDIAELFSLKDETHVQVVKNAQRFEWSSLMLFDCAKCSVLTPEFIDTPTTNPLSMKWGDVGDLPNEWNHCVGYDKPNPKAKLIHFTKGIPIWPETKSCEHSDAWWDELRITNSSVSHQELMGNSVHV